MAIYDTDADSATAITAWLAQYKVAATGAITFVSGTDTFHVKWSTAKNSLGFSC